MRIFCAVRHSVDPRYYYGGLWSANFYPALRQLGHDVVESTVDLLPTSRFMHIPSGFTSEESEMRARTTASILDEVKAQRERTPVDLFLSYFYNSHFDPAGFAELRSLGIPTINFYCNSIYQFDLVSAISAKVDFAWHAERDARPSYLAAGANPVWVQMGADPNVYHPVEGVARKRAACFVGQRYADRDRWLAALVNADVPLAIYGTGWEENPRSSAPDESDASHFGRTTIPPGSIASYTRAIRKNYYDGGLTSAIKRTWKQIRYRLDTRRLGHVLASRSLGATRDIVATFAAYEVCLNFSNVWSDGRPGSDLVPHVRLRDFEAPMCGTCYLTGETDEIHEFYDVGREIDTYATPEELIDKTRFYLNNEAAANSLRRNGYRRARADHTWKARFAELLTKVGLPSHA